MTTTGRLMVCALLSAAGLASGAVYAEITRTPLQKSDVPDANYVAMTVLAEIPAGSSVGRHTHPGAEMDYVVEGEGVLKIDGQPDRPFKAGDSFMIETGKVHDAIIGGGKPAKIVATYVVEKGKPLTTPAP
jgi:quercetin dioxygenase-like cupin family protein